MVELVKNDLEFILRQIKIAEAHSGGTPLTAIRVDAQGVRTKRQLADWVTRGVDYARGLPPK